MSFSARTSLDETENALTRAVARARAEGRTLLDLTASNPTEVVSFDDAAGLEALADPRGLRYEPAALGLPHARETVARALGSGLAGPRATVDPSRVALTASTSEAYAVLFKVLCDPGDEVLVPQPSYPLLSWIAAFESVVLRPYPLVHAGGWHVDLGALAASVGPRTRAVVTVNPNNPTGHYLARSDLASMLDLGLPVISDEVFAGYPLEDRGVPDERVGTVLEAERGLVFALSGLSKPCAFPQLKLGWIAVAGEPARAEAAMRRLDLVLDAYLSVGAPVQHALPRLLEAGAARRAAITRRTRQNLATARAMVATAPAASLLPVEGGWYVMLRVPEVEPDDVWATELVDETSVLVHPGQFFDLARGAHLVLSLLTPEATFGEGLARILAKVAKVA